MNRRTRRRSLPLEVIVSDAEADNRISRWDALLGISAEREAIAKAVAEERAAVVAWLRMSPAEGDALTRIMYEAEAIERGEHRRKEER